MSIQIRSVNGKTKMLPRVVEMLSRQILADVRLGLSSRGVIEFENYDYVVTIKKTNKPVKYSLKRLLDKFKLYLAGTKRSDA